MEINKWYKTDDVKPQLSDNGDYRYFMGINSDGETIVFGGYKGTWGYWPAEEHWFVKGGSEEPFRLDDIIWWIQLP